MTSTTTTKTPTYAGVFAVRGTDVHEFATGLPVGIPVRPRPVVDVPMTGLPLGTAGVIAVQLNSTTPGDLPPRDPLS